MAFKTNCFSRLTSTSSYRHWIHPGSLLKVSKSWLDALAWCRCPMEKYLAVRKKAKTTPPQARCTLRTKVLSQRAFYKAEPEMVEEVCIVSWAVQKNLLKEKKKENLLRRRKKAHVFLSIFTLHKDVSTRNAVQNRPLRDPKCGKQVSSCLHICTFHRLTGVKTLLKRALYTLKGVFHIWTGTYMTFGDGGLAGLKSNIELSPLVFSSLG